MSNPVTIGFIGAGTIGEPMIERLVGTGRPTTVHARRPEVRDRLRDLGAEIASGPVQLADRDVVVSCLFTDDQVLEVCPPIIGAMRPGAVFVSHTTGSPSVLRRLGSMADAVGAAVVEAPFSGNPAAIRRGELTVLLGGEEPAVTVAADVVGAYASTLIRTGRLGTAQPAKLLNNALFAACSQVTLEALRVAHDLGIAEDTLLEVLAAGSGGSAAAGYIAASGQDATAYSARLPRYLRKDLATARAVADELGVDIGALLAAARLGPMDLIDDEPTPDRLASSSS